MYQKSKKYSQKEICEDGVFKPWNDGDYKDHTWVTYRKTNLCFNTGYPGKHRWYLSDVIHQDNTLDYLFREEDIATMHGTEWMKLSFKEMLLRLPQKEREEIMQVFKNVAPL